MSKIVVMEKIFSSGARRPIEWDLETNKAEEYDYCAAGIRWIAEVKLVDNELTIIIPKGQPEFLSGKNQDHLMPCICKGYKKIKGGKLFFECIDTNASGYKADIMVEVVKGGELLGIAV